MINVVMLVKDRPKLTYQALWTLMNHTHFNFSLTVVDDCSRDELRELMALFLPRMQVDIVRLEQPCGVVGRLRNLGAWWSEQAFGRGEALYFSDNDVYFVKGWDAGLRAVYDVNKANGLAVLGGQRHPYHLANAEHFGWVETDAVAGYSHWMSWDIWDLWGPYAANAPGTGQSEDFDFCQRIKTLGGSHMKVGYISEPCIRHCGLTNTEGMPATGAEAFGRATGVIYE